MNNFINKAKYILSVFILVAVSSCNTDDYYLNNPNEPSSTTPNLLLTTICQDVFNTSITGPAYASRQLTYYERFTDVLTYGWNTKDFDEFSTLRQVKNMQDIATKNGQKNYIGLAKFFRAVMFSRLTEFFGDIPYSESLKAAEGIDKPKYDKQEDVYLGLLSELDEANTLLDDKNGVIGGDIIYNGKVSQWKKAVNAFKLRLLIHLSKKEGNSKINIKQQAQAILGDPAKYPLMSSNADNAQLVFNETAPNNYYPLFNSNSVSSLVSLEKGMVSLLKDRQDPRLFAMAEPIQGQAANNFNSYEGVNAGNGLQEQQAAAATASKLKKRYIDNKINEPLIHISFAEQEFIIAEMIARSWAAGPGTATGHYNTGIRSSMQFYGIGGITIEGYISKPLVKFSQDKYQELISTQKYIAMFLQSGWEPFMEQRRTGIPTFNIGPATLNNGQIPKRWRYPVSEFDTNKENMDAAVLRQFGGTETVNSVMWILQ